MEAPLAYLKATADLYAGGQHAAFAYRLDLLPRLSVLKLVAMLAVEYGYGWEKAYLIVYQTLKTKTLRPDA